MADITVLKTKFFIPELTTDFVPRKNLNERFQELETKPLMLVSASTGYGKSTVVARFLKESEHQHSWLSLSNRENDLPRFIRYFTTAINRVNKNIGEDLLDILSSGEAPSPDEMADILSNDLDTLSGLFVLVIDDYHLINNQEVHQFIERLFEFPQPNFRLIIVTRRDPQLPIFTWRSKNELSEIRARDLRFSQEEIKEFCIRSKSFEPSTDLTDQLEIASEGWISGLRMILLAAGTSDEIINGISTFNFKNHQSINGLIERIFEVLGPEIKRCLLSLSILSEFNKGLFQAICGNDESLSLSYSEFLSETINSNLFIINLDEKHNWYRFHHFFAERLFDLLKEDYSEEYIQNLHTKAAEWFEQKGQFDEAVIQYMKAEKTDKALEVFADFRLQSVSTAQFGQLDFVLQIFPKNLIRQNGLLFLAEAWLEFFRGNIVKMAELLDPIEDLLRSEQHPVEDLNLYLGEVFSLKTYDKYLLDVDMVACKTLAEDGIKLTEGKNSYANGLAWIFYGGALQILGESEKAKEEIYGAIQRNTHEAVKAQLLLILWYIDWFEFDLKSAIQTAERLIELGLRTGHKMAISHGQIIKGLCHYMRFENNDALSAFAEQLELSKYFSLKVIALPSWVRLMKLYNENSQSEEAESISQYAEKYVYNQGYAKNRKILLAGKADIEWNLNKHKEGIDWAIKNDFNDFLPLNDVFSPELIQARLLIESELSKNVEKGLSILKMLEEFYAPRNNYNCLGQIHLLFAVGLFDLNKYEEAFDRLDQSLSISQEGALNRTCMELKDKALPLFVEYLLQKSINDKVEGLRKLLTRSSSTNGNALLSNREIEVLLLAQRLTNKEVGNKLFIAEKTVKTHITNINKKLNSSSKIEAFKRAKQLDLLESSYSADNSQVAN